MANETGAERFYYETWEPSESIVQAGKNGLETMFAFAEAYARRLADDKAVLLLTVRGLKGLTERAEKAEAQVRELKAAIFNFDDCPSRPTFCNCAAHLALKKLRGEGPSD